MTAFLPPRIIRSALSLAIVGVAYSAYALVAVPLVEPRQEVVGRKPVDEDVIAQAGNINQRYLQFFKHYFPDPDHWIHDNPKVLHAEQAMLIIRDYHPRDDGLMELKPCAMVFFPDSTTKIEDMPSDAIVLEALEGALLEFEGGLNLAKARIGRLLHGELRGPIRIRSGMREPGPGDDLLVTTRDVKLTQSRIWTDAMVEFQIGRNRGRGRQMEIRLLPGEGGGSSTAGLNIGGLQSFELAREVRMHFDMESAGLLPDDGEPTKEVADARQSAPVDVVCQGPFHFDLLKHVATFEDRVDVIRANTNQPSDQMHCELLAVHFAPKRPAKKQKPLDGSPAEVGPLVPKMLEAQGEPVIVYSPSTGGEARCSRLEYDLISRKITLQSETEVILTKDASEVRAPSLVYQPAKRAGRIGTLWASGPGWLRSTPGDDPTQQFHVRWQKQVHLRRHEGVPVISVSGRPEIELTGQGKMTADEIHLWLSEHKTTQKTRAGKKSSVDIQPDRMMAQGQVEVESPELSARVNRLEMWLRHLPAAATQAAAAWPSHLRLTQHRSEALPAGAANPTAAAAAAPPQRHYDVQGELLKLQVAVRDRAMEVTDVTVERQVVFRETQTAQSDELPLVVRGDRLQLSKAQTEQSEVEVAGQPAMVEARGMTMEGAKIELKRGTNRLEIDGSGKMTLPIDRDLSGEAVTQGGRLAVDWQGGMTFDGQRMQFSRSVVARTDHQRLDTDMLSVQLNQRIDFARSRQAGNAAADEIAVREVVCSGGVMLLSRTLDAAGQTTSVDRFRVKEMAINQDTGELFAQGPGWLKTVRMPGQSPGGGVAGGVVPGAGEIRLDGKLTYLRVDFAREMRGNIKRRSTTFFGNVNTIYGPVDAWDQVVDADAPQGLGERDVLLQSQELTVAEMTHDRREEASLELEAKGNLSIEGRQFTAQAHRMTYAQSKELMVLEGDSRSDAHLWRQASPGSAASHAQARKILFWRLDNRIEVDDAKYLNLSELGQGGGGLR